MKIKHIFVWTFFVFWFRLSYEIGDKKGFIQNVSFLFLNSFIDFFYRYADDPERVSKEN